ncbi:MULTISPECIES: OprD family porin [Pseudomonas]|uniref:OprD family porin n=1 Tax=Pseudomonas TaxID=286 RepID=UPI0009E4F3D5|nr:MULTISPECIES: OprD family porin [Pseudomonas]
MQTHRVNTTTTPPSIHWRYGVPLLGILLAPWALAGNAVAQGFIEESTAKLTTRNYYMDRDYKDDGAKSAAREWAQGFILKMESGYTPGEIGFGLDVTGLLGVKLDSSPERSGTELLPVSASTGRAADEYSRLAPTAKVRAGKSVLKVGDVSPFLPSIVASPARLLPQSFRGAYLQSMDVDDLTLHAGYLDRINRRDSSNYQAMTVASPNRRFNPTAESSHAVFFGGDYQVSQRLKLRAYHTEVAELYRQEYLGLLHELPIGPGVLSTDLRAFDSGEDGSARAGKVDNRNLAAQFAYAIDGHRFTLGYMHQSGDSAKPYISGTESMVISEMAMSSDFVNPKERTWQAIYDHDFATTGIPGLKTRLRYLRGDNIELVALGGSDLKERELQLEVGYVIQSGTFKGVGLKARHSIYRNDFPTAASFRDENQTRLHIDYTLALW